MKVDWGQNLSRHPHLHCLIPAGVLSPNGEWKPAKNAYLFPVRALARHFRGAMVSLLRRSAQQGELHGLTHPGEVDHILNEVMAKKWAVYTKAPLSASQRLIGYLARYSHRTAISNSRLLSDDGQTVRFRYRDYRDGKQKVLSLSGVEFVRRFLQHVLPKGLQRIRHYGYLANACRTKKRPQLLTAIAEAEAKASGRRDEASRAGSQATRQRQAGPVHCECHCPRCHQTMRLLAMIPPRPQWSG